MLDTLHEAIREQTRPNKARSLSTFVRTFCVPVSRSLQQVLEEYALTFPPADQELEPLLGSTGFHETADEYAAEFDKLLDKSLAAELATRLADKGYSVLNTVSLVIVLADFQEVGTLDRLSLVVRSLSAACTRRRSASNAFYFVGGFIVRRGRSPGDENDSQPLPDQWKKNLSDIADVFSRIWVIDKSDDQGMEICFFDQCCLLENLVHMLTAAHAECDTEHEMAEWLSRGHAYNGDVDFLGGAAITLPVDEMIEVAALVRTAQAARRALLGKPVASRPEVWVRTFQQEQRMVTLEDGRQWLRSCRGLNLDPFSVLEPGEDPHLYLERVEIVDASLPRICADNEKRMRAFTNDKTREWEHVLGRYLDSIIATEPCGMAVAVSFLELLAEALRQITPEEIPDARYSDSHSERAKLADLLENTPSNAALALRAGFGFGCVASGAAAFRSDFGLLLEISALGLLSFGAVAFAIHHIARERIRNRIVTIEELERTKWDAISTTAETRIIKTWCESALSCIDSLLARLKAATERVVFLCDFFEKEYSPQFPAESAIRLLLIRDRAGCAQFLPLVSEFASGSINVLTPKMEFLWYRLADPQEPEPNAWESEFFQAAGIKALPLCSALISLSVASAMQQEPTIKARFLNRLQVIVRPFGHVAAGAQEGQLVLILEATELDTSPVLKEIVEELKNRWADRVHLTAHASPYYLLLYSRQENIPCQSVELQGGR